MKRLSVERDYSASIYAGYRHSLLFPHQFVLKSVVASVAR
jgi:hypothetical protein